MQTQYQSIVDLAWAVEEARKQKHDLIADTRQLTIVTPPGDDLQLAVGNGQSFEINDHAHRQMQSHLAIPAPYYDRMRREAPNLLAENMNHWFQAKPERRMVRTMNGTARAFLSDRYQRIDNEEILAAVFPVLQEFGSGLQVQSLALTESRMYLKATVPTIRSEIKVGDIVEAGIEIRNGEIGNSRLEVWPFAYRLTCLNGMRFNVGGFKRTHVGGRADVTEDVYTMLQDDTLKADDKAFLLKARDVVKATLSEKTFQTLVLKMKESTEDKIEGNPIKAIEVLADKFSLSETEQGNVLRHLIEGGDLSRWGVGNAVTRYAQDIECYDRADELEGFGGKIIELPANEWRQVALAA